MNIGSFIWNIADDVLRGVYTRGKYRDIILPMTVIRRLDAVLEPTKAAVLARKAELDALDLPPAAQEPALNKAAAQAFHNGSPFTLKQLLSRPNPATQRADFESYLDGFSGNVREIIEQFGFRKQLDTLERAGILHALLEKFCDDRVNLSPLPIRDDDGRIRLPAMDNHAMGTLFEELLRKFNEENNEEAGEHFTPRDIIELMAELVFRPVADQIGDSTYLLYDDACGTGGMLTVGEEKLARLATKAGKAAEIYLYGQESNPETYAICKADLLIKGEGAEARNIAPNSTLSADAHGRQGLRFDFMMANPPFGKTWKLDLAAMGGKTAALDPRFVVQHPGLDGDDKRLRLFPRVSDGQLLFLVNKLSKMKDTPLGSRIADIHNGSALFTGEAGSGESNVRRWIIENDWLEAIVALPLNIFYNTGIATYVWVLSNRKTEARKGKVQLIDATKWFRPLRRNLGKRNCEMTPEHIQAVMDAYAAMETNDSSVVLPNSSFGYRPGYDDLCRIWMPEEATGWYAHIAEAIEELREELRSMQAANATPEQFGLKVRSHPDTLIVTARNKMGSGEKLRVSIGLGEKFAETATLKWDAQSLDANRMATRRLVERMAETGAPLSSAQQGSGGWLVEGVSPGPVQDFISEFQNHPGSMLTDPGPVRRYIEDRRETELASWDVLFASVRSHDPKGVTDTSLGLPIHCQRRSAGKRSILGNTLRVTNKQRVASRGTEKAGLTDAQIDAAQQDYRGRHLGKENFPDSIYRKVRDRPLLIVHLLTIGPDGGDLSNQQPVIAWSISFPRTEMEEKRVDYVVNTTWWRENYSDELDEEDMAGDED